MTKAICGTPVNLVASTGEKEAAFTLDAKISVDSTFSPKTKINVPRNIKSSIKNVCEKTLKHFKLKEGINVKLGESKLIGLPGVCEAVCVATVFSLAGEIARVRGSINILRVDKYLQDQFFVIDGRVVKKEALLDLCFVKGSSFAKTAASLYGGFVVSAGTEILRNGEMEDLYVETVKTKTRKINSSPELEIAWMQAYAGNLYSAMNLSAALSSQAPAPKNKGALAVSLDNGYKIIVYRSKKQPLKTLNEHVTVCEKPKRIYKIKDFLNLPGSEGYSIYSR